MNVPLRLLQIGQRHRIDVEHRVLARDRDVIDEHLRIARASDRDLAGGG